MKQAHQTRIFGWLVRCILVYDFPKATIILVQHAEVLITHIFDVTHDGGEN